MFLSCIYGGSHPEKRLIMAVNTKEQKHVLQQTRGSVQTVSVDKRANNSTHKQTNKRQGYLKKLKSEGFFCILERDRNILIFSTRCGFFSLWCFYVLNIHL